MHIVVKGIVAVVIVVCTACGDDAALPYQSCEAPAPLPTSNVCPANFEPVCGCDGVTYNNSCAAGAAGIHVAFSLPCP